MKDVWGFRCLRRCKKCKRKMPMQGGRTTNGGKIWLCAECVKP